VSILTRNKKVAAGVGVAAAAAAAIALGTGTYAAFSATTVGPSGTLAAGNMSLTIGGANSTDLYTASGLYPTQTVTKIVTFTNNSGVDGILSGTENLTDPVDGAADGDWLPYQLTQASSCVGSTTGTTGATFLKDVNGNVVGSGVVIPANGGTATCTFTFNLPDRPDNNLVQGDSIKVSSSFTLTQKIM
jgi:predicted ribosomally synthesized peptide with SipW-like signal peptide